MNRGSFILILMLTTTWINAQSVYLVDNSNNAPTGDHVYVSLQEAIDAAESGDIIQVAPSATSYGEISITDKDDLKIYGIGFNTIYASSTIQNNSTITSIEINQSSNLTISGVLVLETFKVLYQSDPVSEEILIENSMIRKTLTLEKSSNIRFSNNYLSAINMSGGVSDYTNVYFHNNVFGRSDSYSDDLNFKNAVIDHNLIYDMQFVAVTNNTFTNNVFFSTGFYRNDDFNNNILNNNFSDVTLQIGSYNNTGNANSIVDLDRDEIFGDEKVSNAYWQSNWDPTPIRAEIIDKGSDGTDIGPTGGTGPYKVTVFSLPAVTKLVSPNTVSFGETFEVSLEAVSN